MEKKEQEIGTLNDKLVELYGKLARIKYKLDTLDKDDETQPIDKPNSDQGAEQRQVQASERPSK